MADNAPARYSALQPNALADIGKRYVRNVLSVPQDMEGEYDGFYDPSTRNLYLNRLLTGDAREDIRTHELGHAAATSFEMDIGRRWPRVTPDELYYVNQMRADPTSLENAFGAEELRQRMLDTQTFRNPAPAWGVVNRATAQGFDPAVDTEMRSARAHKQEMANSANNILLNYFARRGAR